MDYRTIEGTWEEILTHAPELVGHRLRVLVLDVEPAPETEKPPSDPDERQQAFETLMKPLPNVPVLSDSAMSRENIYADRG